MRQPSLPLTVLFLLMVACNNPDSLKNANRSVDTSKTTSLPDGLSHPDSVVQVDSASAIPTNKPVTLVVKHRHKYSKSFLDNLKSSTYSDHYQLQDSMLIIERQDTSYFPTVLPLDTIVRFTGKFMNKKHDANGDLFLKRINYTTVWYRYSLIYWGKKSHKGEGYIDISESFFLGPENDEDSYLNISYASTEYYSEKDDCYFAIRIGTFEKYHNKLLAKITRNCQDESKNIYLETSPLLGENNK